ncbi:MAG: hypothetical protein GY869_27860, partial [Planctomycetes bacterium]|nr:hypothetical protein [Planctomycetota bacterium]
MSLGLPPIPRAFAQNSDTVPLIVQTPDGPSPAIFVLGNLAYVANGSALDIVDISDPSSPDRIGRFVAPGMVFDVVAVGELACLVYMQTYEFGGLFVLDVSNPAEPIQIGQMDLSGYSINSIWIEGNLAYVLTGAELRIVDISEHSTPTLLSALELEGGAFRIAVQGDYAYVGGSGVHIIDISDPENPFELSTSGFMLNHGIAVNGQYAYVSEDRLRVIDISDPANPSDVGLSQPISQSEQLSISGDYAYVAKEQFQLSIIDISDPANPQEINTIDLPGVGYDVFTTDDYLYTSSISGGAAIFETIDPASPTPIGYYHTPGVPNAIDIHYTRCHVTYGSSTYHLYDLSDLSQPDQLGSNRLDISTNNVVANQTTAFIVDGANLHAFDISVPELPREIGFFTASSLIQSLVLQDQQAFLVNGSAGLPLLAISLPA